MNIAALKTNFSAAEAVVDRQEAFKNYLRGVIKAEIVSVSAEGTVGISADCLWALVGGQSSRSVHSPVGTNARYYARQAFGEVVSEKQFSKFVYQD